MDNGDGRPLDEEEAGQDDPQGWYFDLPGGAWERQEEKNRTLRQRVLGNFEEDAEKAKGDPFAKKFEAPRPRPEPKFELRRPEPEQPKKRGLFGLGKKKGPDADRPEIQGGIPMDDDAEADEEWSTEPPLKLSPFPRTGRSEEETTWGESDAGWDLGGKSDDEGAGDVDGSDFVSGLRSWAHGESSGEPEVQHEATFGADTGVASEAWPTEAESESVQAVEDDGDFLSGLRAWAQHDNSDGEQQGPVAEPEAEPWPAAVAEGEPVAEDDSDFAASIRAWAEAPRDDVETRSPSFQLEARDTPEETDAFAWSAGSDSRAEGDTDPPTEWTTAENGAFEDAGAAPTFEAETAAPDTLVLRPRQRQDDGKSLDWNFGPAAWSERGDDPVSDGAGEDDDVSALETMRKWAERNKDKDHPHFTTAHTSDEGEPPAAPAPIPLRPRHLSEAEQPIAQLPPAPPEAHDGDAPAPPSLPIRLRSRTEPEEPTARTNPEGGPTKWDDFFNINPPASEGPQGTDGDEDAEGNLGEGLSAMRAWAQKRPEPDASEDIPEEFLKPFDWELQEDATDDGDARGEIPAEFLKPFEWEEKPQSADTFEPAAPGEGAATDDGENPGDEGPEPLLFPIRSFDVTEADSDGSTGSEDADDDPLAGLFERPEALAPVEKKGRFRLFGRGKDKHEPDTPREDSAEAGDWILPGEDQRDVRSVAKSPWTEDGGNAEASQLEEGVPSMGWGAAREAAWTASDDAAIEQFASAVSLPADPEATAEFEVPDLDRFEVAAIDESDADNLEDGGRTPETIATAEPRPWDSEQEGDATVADEDGGGWDPEPVAPVAMAGTTGASWFAADAHEADGDTEPLAAAEAPGVPAAESDDVEVAEAVAPVAEVAEAAAEKGWWEAASDDEAVEVAPVEAVAPVEEVAEPVAEKSWWEAASDDEPVDVPPVEAVASVEEVAEPVAEKPWWEAASDDEAVAAAPVEAVAPVEEVVEPVAEKKAWWEVASDDEAVEVTPVEAVASVEEAAEPVAAKKPWWQTGSDDEAIEVAPVEAVASVEEVAEPVAETPWWEAASDDEAIEVAPVEAVASVDEVAEPVAEKAWWEVASDDEAVEVAPVEAVASVEEVAEPVAEKAWWEAASDDEAVEVAPVEAVASVEKVAEPLAEKAWWEAASEDDAAAEETPVEAVAPIRGVDDAPGSSAPAEVFAVAAETAEPNVDAAIEATAGGDGEPEKPWWQRTAEEVIEPEETAAALGSSAPDEDDDDPWADFVARPAAAQPVPPPPMPSTWSAAPGEPRDEDMWGDIAATAEQAAGQPAHDIDLAASLESQMAEETPAYSWNEPEEQDWDAAPAVTAELPSQSEDDEDVILAAFERHAATPESPEARREQDEALAELLGEQAADIVAEASDEHSGQRSFIRMSGWAPQRGANDFDGGWAPQQDVEDTLARNQRPFNFGATDGDGFAPPSWAVDEMEPDEGHVPQRGHKTKTWIREIVETGLLAFLVFLSVRASFQNFKVEGSSMSPTLEDGQFLIVNKLVYAEVDMDKLGKYVPFIDGGNDPERNVFHGPERGDIVVLVDPRNPETDLIKRVIGLPGETVEIVNGKVYINDRLLEEPYITSVWHDTRPKILVPPDEYFVMGDNRDNSLDSRNSAVSTVPKDLIIGKAMLSYWPSSKFGLAPNASPDLTDEKPVLTTQRIGED